MMPLGWHDVTLVGPKVDPLGFVLSEETFELPERK